MALRRLLIVGADEPLGARLIDLAHATSIDVIAYPRSDALASTQFRVFDGDLNRPEDTTALLDTVDAVIIVPQRGVHDADYDSLAQRNVETTRRLYQACDRSGVARFLLVSSGAMYRPRLGHHSESHPLEPTSPFEQTLMDAEEALRRDRARARTPYTIARLAPLYGPNITDTGATLMALPRIARWAWRRCPRFDAGPRSHWLHIDDAAATLLALAEHPAAAWDILNVCDRSPTGLGEALVHLARLQGLTLGTAKRWPFDQWSGLSMVLFGAPIQQQSCEIVVRTLWRLIQRRHRLANVWSPRIDRSLQRLAAHPMHLDRRKLNALDLPLRFSSIISGSAHTLAWYRCAGWMP